MKIEQTTMSLFTGNQLRDFSVTSALEHAEEESPGWTEQALSYLSRYPEAEFMTEQVRGWAHSQGLPLPPNPRAWGGVITKARKLGKIRFVEYRNVSNPKAHSTPAAVWRRT